MREKQRGIYVMRSALAMVAGYTTFVFLNGVFYITSIVLNARGILEDGAFARHELAVATVTMACSVLGGVVLGRIAPSHPVRHALIYSGLLVIYMAAMFYGSVDTTRVDFWGAWAQVAPGAILGAYLFAFYKSRMQK